GLVVIALVDLRERHELVDLDGVRALELDCLELIIVHDDELVLAGLVALADLVAGDLFAGLAIHLLVADAVSRRLVDLAERDLLRARRRRRERDRARDERELEVALPIGTRRHGTLLRNGQKATKSRI